jgi:hypothetical protein
LEGEVEQNRTEVLFDTKAGPPKAFFDKLAVVQKVKSLSTIYGDGKFVTVSTKARRLSIF